VDGPGRTILETATHIDRTRIDYHIAPLVPDDGAQHPLVVAARARGVPVEPVHDPGDSLAALTDRVIELIDRLGVQVLHSSEFRSNIVALRCRSKRPKLRIVSTAHGWIANDMRGKLMTFLDRILLRRFDRVILVSQAMRRRLPAWWVPDRRVIVLRNALAFERYSGGARSRARLAPDPAGDRTLLNVGRLSAEKGQALLLRAVAELGTAYPRLRLTFAGTGPLEAELRQLADRLGIADRVKFIGYVTDMADVYDSASLVVQSSFTEGLPNVILEAAYLGVPIVATNVGGTAEVIEHGISGWLIPPRSLNALAGGIRYFLENSGRFAEMSVSARSRIEEHFSFQARTSGQMSIYEELSRGPA
jgi:glycosyltransferase involved in cell wall biosynthesis